MTVGGIPLVVRSIQSALGTSNHDGVYVTTDDDEIAAMSQSAGARVIRRPAELAMDTSSSDSAMLHAIDELGLRTGSLVLVQPTSPFLISEDISRIFDERERCDSCLTVSESHLFIWKRAVNGSLAGVNHDLTRRLRRQDITDQEFFENGAAYGIDIAQFLKHQHRFFGRVGYVVMPRLRSLEIDTFDDLELANLISSVVDAQ
jgi:CMP-N-acetylneuraminic acid synthetase